MTASNQVDIPDFMAKLDAMGATAPVSDDEHAANISAIKAKHRAATKADADKHAALMAEFAAVEVAAQVHLAQVKLSLSVPVLTFNEAVRQQLGFGLLANNAR